MRDRVCSLRTRLLEAGAVVGLAAVCIGGGAAGAGAQTAAAQTTAAQTTTAAAANSGPRSGDRDDARAQRETLAKIRNAGTAMFSWLTDQVGAAAAGQKTVNLAEIPTVSSFAELKKLLVPQYIQELPDRDGWGNPFEYRLNVKNPTAKSVMSIRSPGRDGTFSGLTYVIGAFPRADYDHDIVWADGYFVQWPQ